MASTRGLFVFIVAIFYISLERNAVGVELDCSIGSTSCELCHGTFPYCYWCDSKPPGMQCRRYNGKFVDIECPGNWKYETCESKVDNEKSKLERIYRVLLELKNRGRPDYSYQGNQLHGYQTQNFNFREENRGKGVEGHQYNYEGEAGQFKTMSTTDVNPRKARLLKALKLLKLIERLEAKQSRGSQKMAEDKSPQITLNHVDRGREGIHVKHSGTGGNGRETDRQVNELLNQYTGSTGHAFKQGIVGKHHQDLPDLVSEHDLDELMNRVGGDVNSTQNIGGHHEKISIKSPLKVPSETKNKVVTRQPKFTKVTLPPRQAKTFVHGTTHPLRIQENLEAIDQKHPVTVPNSNKGHVLYGCSVLEEEDECNSNSSCSWCNLMDVCINRKEEDMKFCYSQSKRNLDEGYAVDPCLKNSKCERCVKDSKCFWCDQSKSCHVYPFFGFVPHNCPANKWYYKDCDVQLAIFIILFPLLIILIAMIIFYFCLRYCYYRKRTLKVPLFEKPGLIEKKKGKKIYFMSGEEDDDEYRTEQIRKKYKLPVEKEPLIAP